MPLAEQPDRQLVDVGDRVFIDPNEDAIIETQTGMVMLAITDWPAA